MVKFGELTNQNPWWKYGKNFSRFDRHLSQLRQQKIQIERKKIQLKQDTIIVIRGCRQTGKTTYIKQNIANLVNIEIKPESIMYLSVDQLIKSRREFRNAIDSFLTRNIDKEEVYIFLDEITALKDWNHELKRLSDTGITNKARIIVTGSSGAALRDISEQIPGRGLEGNEYILKPITFREYIHQTLQYFISQSASNELAEALIRLKEILPKTSISPNENINQISKACHRVLPFQQELNHLFNHYLRSGGFPMSINSYLKQGDNQIDSQIAENFVRITLGALSYYGKNETTARQLLDEIIKKYGSLFSFTSLSDQVNHVTTGDYLDFLEKSFILHIHYAIDLDKKTIKYKGRKKAYFQDPFMFHSLKSWLTGTNLNDVINEALDDDLLLGEIVEATVTSHIVSCNEIPYMREKNTFNWFYYDQRGREIDNIVKNDQYYDAIEVKYRNNVDTRDVTKTQGLRQTIILSKDDFMETENTCVIPTSVYLSLLERSSRNL